MTAIRIGIYLLVAFAVLAHGAVEPWSESILEIGAAGLFLLWGLFVVGQKEAEIRWNWLFLPLLGWMGLGLAQSAFGLTAYSYATKLDLLRYAACGLLMFLGVQTLRTSEQFKGFFWFLVTFAFFVSLFGIVQHFTFNGKLYWLRVLHQGGIPFGPYVNRNHFAGFLELILPLALAILFQGAARHDKLPLLGLFTIVPVGALVLSGSRGGIVSFFFEIVLLGLLVRTHQSGRAQLLLATGLALSAGLLVAWLGVRGTIQRFRLSSPTEVSQDRRISMLKDTWQIFLTHPWMGTGLGTLETVYPRYESDYDGLVVNHTHNDYLELLSDAGVAGGILGVFFVGYLFWRGLSNLSNTKSRVNRALSTGSLVGCSGLLLHSLVDFNLHIPSNALIFLLLAGVATAEIPEPDPARKFSSRF